MFISFRLDHRGLADLLKHEAMGRAVDTAAQAVAQGARSRLPDATVTVASQVTDRHRATVMVQDRRADGRAELIGAARAAGLQVHEHR
ncbi:hypothetical protein [Streptomyces corynorhini]|uniref:Uncharacterized protein n=1 Tax=Streptomyces corynorhini TaxID=2282652 RepID=A0A370BEU5_9ACTN|nr:hypothetical protein [Streptomyces corynorhini]RDG37965.1 hypothetical protein DVH02_11620 [Streptomyces corynorhini]